MRVAIYGRVSTSHQVDHQTIEQQLERLSTHVRAHAAEGWMLDPAHVFRDDGYSGADLPPLWRFSRSLRGFRQRGGHAGPFSAGHEEPSASSRSKLRALT
jgi:Resolvase, N terminal domain